MTGFRHPPLARDWIDAEHRRFEIGELPLESGATLRDAFVSYVIHGDLAHLRERTIVVATAIGATHHRLDFLIGPGAALDSDRHCVVAIDALGNGLSSSPSNSIAQPGATFPRFTLRDMVASQRRLLDHLGVGRVVAVVGASMGGMQALQWAVSDPGRMARVIAMTPMARTSRWSQLVNEMARRALFVDRDCRTPRRRGEAMRLWIPLSQLLMMRTPDAIEEFRTQDALVRWLDERATELADDGPDAFDWCHQSWAYDAHDVGTTPGFGGDTLRALASIRAKTLILAPALDLYNPAFAARAACEAIPGARFVALPGDDGHRSASGVSAGSTDALRSAIRSFLAGTAG